MKKKTDLYLIYIEPYVYSNKNNQTYLFYNTLDGKKIIIEYPSAKLKIIFNSLFNKKNNFVTVVPSHFLKDEAVNKFVKKIKKGFMGDAFLHNKKSIPVQFSPIINIQEAKTFNGWNIEINILSNIKKIEILLQSSDSNINSIERSIERYLKSENKILGETNYNDIAEIFELSECHKFWDIKFGICNIKEINYKTKLINILEKLDNHIQFFAPFTIENFNFFQKLEKQFNLAKTEYFLLASQAISEKNRIEELGIKLNIFIENNYQIAKVNDLMCNTSNLKYDFIPSKKYLQNVNNISFSKRELFSGIQNLKEILMKGEFNPLLYGKIYISTDSSVFSNLNKEKLGLLSEVSIFDILRKEIEENRNWFETRKDIRPCKSCIYNLICSPISNYEWEINRFNNCFMRVN